MIELITAIKLTIAWDHYVATNRFHVQKNSRWATFVVCQGYKPLGIRF